MSMLLAEGINALRTANIEQRVVAMKTLAT